MTGEKERCSRIYRYVSPYPGECCYSILARCRVYSGYSTSRFIYELTGTLRRLDRFLFMPFPYASSDISAFEIERAVNRHSCLPYTAPILDEEDLNLVRKLMSESVLSTGEQKRLTRHTGVTHWRKQFLCYCPLCVELDREQYGETYWHLIHQIPGVWMCPDHDVKIKESDIPVNSTRFELIPAEYAIHSLSQMQIQKETNTLLTLISTESQWLLENGFKIPLSVRKMILSDVFLSKKEELVLAYNLSDIEDCSHADIVWLILFLNCQGKRISTMDFY